MKKPMGLGLDAIFEDNDFVIEQPRKEEGIHTLRISQIEPNRNQPRKVFDEEALQALADSIEKHGLIQPLLVEPLEKDRYRIIAGERRYRAAKLAGLETMPIIVKDYTESEISEISLVENLQREDLNPLEEAFGYKKLMISYGLTQEQVATKVSKSRSAVANSMRLLALPEGALEYVRTGELSAGHARTLLALENPDDILAAANKIISEELSVRQTEDLVKRMKTVKAEKPLPDPEVTLALKELENRARVGTGNKVKIKHSAKNTGKIEIFYSSTDELEKLIDMLS